MSYAKLVHSPTVLGRSPLWRDMDRLFDSFGMRGLPAGVPAHTRARVGFVPKVEVEKTEEGFTLTAELPGFDEDEFEVLVEDGSLTIKGAKTLEAKAEGEDEAVGDEGDGEVVQSRTHKEFTRRFRLGKDIDVDAVAAQYSNGLLTVSLPKVVQQSTLRAIPVTSS